ncbi:MAG: hypothetical protein ACOCVF_02860 [bacterium]
MKEENKRIIKLYEVIFLTVGRGVIAILVSLDFKKIFEYYKNQPDIIIGMYIALFSIFFWAFYPLIKELYFQNYYIGKELYYLIKKIK